MLEMDLKGIPQSLCKQANKEQGAQINRVKKTIEQYLKDNGLN